MTGEPLFDPEMVKRMQAALKNNAKLIDPEMVKRIQATFKNTRLIDPEMAKQLQAAATKFASIDPASAKQFQAAAQRFASIDPAVMKHSLPTVEVRSDLTLRVDAELRARAKELGINISRFLETTLRDEVERREMRAAAAAAGESEEIRLDLVDSKDRPYVGKFRGKLLGEAREVAVYLADDERVIAYDAERQTYSEIDDLTELEDLFRHDLEVYVEIMHALGETPEIDI